MANPGATNIPAAFQRWKMLSSGDNWRFDDYAGFLMQWRGWPEEARFRRNAETMLDMSSWSPAAAVAYFDRFAPLTNDGRAKYALALGQIGRRDAARDMARTAWRGGALTDDNALRLQALHTADFSRADHDARMDALLWQGAVRAAAAPHAHPAGGRCRSPRVAARLRRREGRRGRRGHRRRAPRSPRLGPLVRPPDMAIPRPEASGRGIAGDLIHRCGGRVGTRSGCSPRRPRHRTGWRRSGR